MTRRRIRWTLEEWQAVLDHTSKLLVCDTPFKDALESAMQTLPTDRRRKVDDHTTYVIKGELVKRGLKVPPKPERAPEAEPKPRPQVVQKPQFKFQLLDALERIASSLERIEIVLDVTKPEQRVESKPQPVSAEPTPQAQQPKRPVVLLFGMHPEEVPKWQNKFPSIELRAKKVREDGKVDVTAGAEAAVLMHGVRHATSYAVRRIYPHTKICVPAELHKILENIQARFVQH